MPTDVNEKISKLGAAQRKEVEARAGQLIDEETNLRSRKRSLPKSSPIEFLVSDPKE